VADEWWHAFAGPGDLGGDEIWQFILVGPATKGPESARELTMKGLGGEVPYLTSWDHYPSEEEKAATTPEEFRDEVEGPLIEHPAGSRCECS
jgi:hypothetical protein